MHRLFVGAAAVCAVAAVPAFAADMPLKAVPKLLPPPSWSGCYVGANAGAAWDHTYVHDETPPFGPIATLDDTAVAVGGQVGCDYQFAGNFVIGVQGMIDTTALQASTTGPLLMPAFLNGKVPWVYTVTGRLGFAVTPDWLLYAKGGGAWTHVDSTLTVAGTVVDSANFDLSGWTAGGGIEWKLAPQWSIFSEYDYLQFSDKLVISVNGNNLGIVQQHEQLALVGVNLRFVPGR